MVAFYTVGQVLGSGATVTADTFVTLADGTTIETMDAAYPNGAHDHTVITTAAPSSTTANASTLQQRAQNALTTNATFLAIASPTNTQVATQVQALTKECSALIRLLLGQLDTVTGT